MSAVGDTMSTQGCSVHRGLSRVRWGDTMSTLGVFSTAGGYREYTG